MNDIKFKLHNFFVRIPSFFIFSEKKRKQFRAKYEYVNGSQNNYLYIIREDGSKVRSYLAPKGLEIEFRNGKNNVVEVHENAIWGRTHVIFQGDNSNLKIGKNFTSNDVTFYMFEDNSSVTIGDDCMFSSYVNFFAADAHSLVRLGDKTAYNLPKPVVIGNHVWIGFNAQVLKGTVISDNSVIGLGAVVCGEFKESNIIIAGNPAKIIKHRIKWDRSSSHYYHS